MDVDVADLDVGIVANGIEIHLSSAVLRDGCCAVEPDGAAAFTGCQVGSVFWSIGLQRPFEADTIGDTVVTHYFRVKHGCQETKVLCLGVEPDIGFQLIEVCHVTCSSVGCEVECRRQRDVKPGELHLLYVAIQRPLDADGVVGVALDKLLGHVTDESHQVLLAKLCIQTKPHVAGILFIESIEVHIHLRSHVGVRRLENHGRYLNVIHRGVKFETTSEVCYF